MWKRFSLRSRIFLLLAALVATTLAGAVVTLWHNDSTDALLGSLIEKNVASFHAAEELEAALLRQKGFLTYFFLDGDQKWLMEMDKNHRVFEEWLEKARRSSYTAPMGEMIKKIDSGYHNYVLARAKVIDLYKEGRREEGASVHWQLRNQFTELIDQCQRYKLIHEYAIARVRTESKARAKFINAFALGAMPVVGVLAVLLAYILIKQILQPIRRLAQETASANPGTPVADEVKALSSRVYSLIEDMDQAQSELEQTQEHLLQSGKWAMVGKLAAGVAHSIRNPLTSVKMRLFSMERTLKLTVPQREDIEVISEEIRHIDTIVRNFLEFSRPPKLKMQEISPSDVVDNALVLLRYRLESYGVEVKLLREAPLPRIWGDPDQLKEVLANLLINACEVMVNGGRIIIREEVTAAPGQAPAAVIRVSDNGPGIPESIQEKVFQPFFSTKEEGTGLGLAIATRIINDHGGRLALESRKGEGTTFIISLPLKEEK